MACSPPSGDGQASTSAATRTYATQTRAPSPDYRALLKQPATGGAGWRQRKATALLPPDAKAVGDLWVARLRERGALLGHGLAGKGPDGPVNLIDVGLTEQEFELWVGENGWRVPGHIRWSFVPLMSLPPMSGTAKAGVRVWPASTARTGVQHQALFHGRVELRNGCFFVGEVGKSADKLAWFHAEIGLGRDKAGYYIFRDRVSGQTLARLGEEMSWGGPASAHIDEETERALQQACGPGEVYVVGSPEASERFLTQYPHLRQLQVPSPPPSTAS